MIPIQALFEAHLPVSDLQRSIDFYQRTLGLELASVLDDRKVAFCWIGGRGASMLGLWESGSSPQRLSLHVAFRVELEGLLGAADLLRAAGITPLDFQGRPAEGPIVLAWMPAAAIYFRDPDGHLLEFLSMLPEHPRPDLGVLSWEEWRTRVDGGSASRTCEDEASQVIQAAADGIGLKTQTLNG